MPASTSFAHMTRREVPLNEVRAFVDIWDTYVPPFGPSLPSHFPDLLRSGVLRPLPVPPS